MRNRKSEKNITFVPMFVGILFCALYLNIDILNKIGIQMTEKILVNNENRQKRELAKQEDNTYENFSFNYSYKINVQGNGNPIIVEFMLPQDENQKQYISNLRYSPQPFQVTRQGLNTIAEFRFENVFSGDFIVSLSGFLKQRTYDYETALKINNNPKPEKNLSQYLRPARYIESNDASIIATAETLRGDTIKETVDNTFNFVQQNMTYKKSTEPKGAKEALRTKQGVCHEYSCLMIALLRANNIPARIAVGHVITAENKITQPHAWVEVYYDSFGWVVYDPTIIIEDIFGNIQNNTLAANPSKNYGRRYISLGKNTYSQFKLTTMHNDSKDRPKISIIRQHKIEKLDKE